MIKCQNVNVTYHEIDLISKLVDVTMMMRQDNDHSEEMSISAVTETLKTELCFI